MGKRFTDDQFRDAFFSNFERTDGCWIWSGNINHNGYGHFFCRIEDQVFYRAHRYSYALFVGQIPKGHVVMHSCDVRHCVNPKHLSVGTQAQNLADRDRKGRNVQGVRVANSKLTVEQARIAKYSGRPPSELGREFGVHPTCITAIRGGRNWKHI